MRTRHLLLAALALLLVTVPVPAWAGDIAPLSIRLGIVTTPGSAQYIAAEHFKRLIAEKSDGAVEVTILHSASLGSETDILQQVQMGAVDMAIVTAGPFDTFVPEVSVVGFPFLFADHAQADRVLDGPAGAEALKSLERAGFKGLAFSENGFRNLTNNVRPVFTAADADGLKIRVMESVLHKELWRALGANPTPMAWPIYAELQQGTIDGQENPLSVIWTYKLYEVQKHLTLTRHVYSAHIDVAGLAWFNRQDAPTRELITACMREAARLQRAWNRENLAGFLKNLEDQGMAVVHRPDLASFQAKAAGLRELERFQEPRTKALLDTFFKAVGR